MRATFYFTEALHTCESCRTQTLVKFSETVSQETCVIAGCKAQGEIEVFWPTYEATFPLSPTVTVGTFEFVVAGYAVAL